MKLSVNHKKISKAETHYVYTEETNNLALNSNDDKILQTFGRITSFSHGASVGKEWKTELLEYWI